VSEVQQGHLLPQIHEMMMDRPIMEIMMVSLFL
jgi:hypothetical protein